MKCITGSAGAVNSEVGGKSASGDAATAATGDVTTEDGGFASGVATGAGTGAAATVEVGGAGTGTVSGNWPPGVRAGTPCPFGRLRGATDVVSITFPTRETWELGEVIGSCLRGAVASGAGVTRLGSDGSINVSIFGILEF